MKKKIVSLLLAAVMTFSMLPTALALDESTEDTLPEAIQEETECVESPEDELLELAAVSSGTCGDNLNWTLDEDGTLTISGTGDMDDYDYYIAPWYDYCDNIKTVEIEEGVTSIGVEAFSYCSNLTSVTIPSSATSIGDYAFHYCSSLTSVTIPEGVPSIGDWAFGFCKSLESVTIPEGVTSIGKGAFSNCTSLTSVTIPSSVTSIGDEAFCNCSSLASFQVDKQNQYYSNDAYGVLFNKNQTELIQYPIGNSRMSYTIPSSVTSIGDWAFDRCSSLTSVTIPSSVTSIGNEAFHRCSNLTSVTIPSSVTSIGEDAFYNCSSLTSVTIPSSVTSIGRYAFYYCDSLTDVYYSGSEAQWNALKANIGRYNDPLLKATIHFVGTPEILETGTCGDILTWMLDDEGTLTISGTGDMDDFSYPDYAPWYDYCDNIKTVVIEEGVTSIGVDAFYNCDSLKSVTIPEGVTSIGNYAFLNCSSLTSVTIPEGVTSIGDEAFEDCSSLTSFQVDKQNQYYSNDAYGVLFNKNQTELIQYPIGNSRTSYTIPSSVTSIGDGAFAQCSSLTSVTIPSSVTNIGRFVFYNCSSLTSVTIPEGVTSIGNHAFEGCKALTDITLPNGVTSLGDWAFAYCSSLTSVTIPSSVTSIGDWAFAYCSSLTSVTIPPSVTYIGHNAFYGTPWQEAQGEFVIVNGMLIAYQGSGGDVTIPSSVTSIGSYAFSDCSSLTSVTILEGVTSIGSGAFAYCSSLTSVMIPSSVTSIGYDAFYYCDSLTDVYYSGSEAQWNTLKKSIDSGNNPLLNANVHFVKHTHTFDRQTASDTYLATSATCTKAAKYYYSCECGEKGTSTFSSGNPLGHNYVNGECTRCHQADPSATNMCGENVTWKLEKGTLTISGTGAMTGYTNTNKAPWYDLRSNISKVVIEKGVTSIGTYAFYGCSNLESVTIPEGVTEIGNYAFVNCTSLTSVTIPQGVTSIGNRGFSGCSSLMSITIPEGVTTIGSNAFGNCTGLTTVTFSSTVTSVGNDAFENCSKLTGVYISDLASWCQISFGNDDSNPLSVSHKLYLNDQLVEKLEIPDGTVAIGNYAFYGCNVLTSVAIPSDVISIGDYSFCKCDSLTSVTIPLSVTSIGENAFFGTPWLSAQDDFSVVNHILIKYQGNDETVTIPSIVTRIGNSAFFECNSLVSVNIPEGVTSIGDNAFDGCKALTSVTMPSSMTKVGSHAFHDCIQLEKIQIEDLSAWCNISFESDDSNPLYYSHKLYLNDQLITDPVIPEGITSIKKYSFCGFCSMESVTIPASVTSIENDAFHNCTDLKNVYFNGLESQWNTLKFNIGLNNDPLLNASTHFFDGGVCGDNLKWILDSQGVLTISGTGAMTGYTNTNKAPWYDLRSNISKVVIEKGVTNVGTYAFYGCSDMANITIPRGVKSIGNYAFVNCSSLTSVTIPQGVTSIGNRGFCDCSSLTSVTIPEGVTTIGNNAFGNCTGLTTVTFSSTVTSVGNDAFENCKKLNGVYICDLAAWCQITFGNDDANPLSVSHKLYLDGQLVEKLEIPDGTGKIGNYAFYGYNVLTSALIPSGVKSIGNYAFYKCDSLQSVTISSTVKSIGKNAFNSCCSLTSLELPEGVTSIESKAFNSCSALTRVTIPSSLKKVGIYAFNDCSKLKDLHITDLTAWCNISFDTGSSNPLYYSHMLYLNGQPITDLVIPEGLTTIKKYTFCGFGKMESITIPDTVTSIDDNAFYNCSNLKNVYFNGLKSQWDTLKSNIGLNNDSLLNASNHFADGGVCGDNLRWELNTDDVLTISGTGAMTGYTNTNKAPWYDLRSNISKVVIEKGVTSIGTYAFYGCSNMANITIPQGVKSIGNYAFVNCSSLTSVTIPQGVTSIGNRGFSGCSSLMSITIPEGVTTIGNNAFCDCAALTTVTFSSTVTSVGNDAFENCSKLNGVYISDLAAWCQISFGNDDSNPLRVAHKLYLNGQPITALVIPEGLTSVGKYSFYGFDSMESVTIPKGVTSIGDWAFYECKSLTDVYYSGSETQWNALKANIGLKNDPLLNATIHVNSSASSDGVMVVEKLENDGKVSLGYSFDTEKTGTGTVCAIQYVNGQMVGMKMIEVDLSAASGKTEFTDADGAVYKIILLDSAASPCCAAWQS